MLELHRAPSPFIYGPHLDFTGPPRWGWGGMRHSSLLLEQHVPNDVTGVRGLVGVGARAAAESGANARRGFRVGRRRRERGGSDILSPGVHWSCKLDWRCSAAVSPFASLRLSMHHLQQKEKKHILRSIKKT